MLDPDPDSINPDPQQCLQDFRTNDYEKIKCNILHTLDSSGNTWCQNILHYCSFHFIRIVSRILYRSSAYGTFGFGGSEQGAGASVQVCSYHEENAEHWGEDELPPRHLVHSLITILGKEATEYTSFYVGSGVGSGAKTGPDHDPEEFFRIRSDKYNKSRIQTTAAWFCNICPFSVLQLIYSAGSKADHNQTPETIKCFQL